MIFKDELPQYIKLGHPQQQYAGTAILLGQNVFTVTDLQESTI